MGVSEAGRRICVEVPTTFSPSRAEDYTEELAIAHVRRLLDIVACTTVFAAKKPQPKPDVEDVAAESAKAGSPSLIVA